MPMQAKLGNFGVLVLALAALGTPSYAWQSDDIAAERERTEQQLAQIAAELEKREAAMDQRAKTLSITEQELRQLELQMSDVATELNQTQAQIKQSQERLVALAEQRQQLEQQRDAQLASLAQQLQAAYKMGQHDFLKLLLNQQDAGKLERMLGYYGYLNRARLAQVSALQSTQQQLSEVIASRTEQQQKLEQQAAQQRQQQGVLSEQQNSQEVLIKRLQREQTADNQRVNELKRDQQAVENVLQAIIASLRDEPKLDGLKALQGKLAWPAEGRLQRLFATERSGGVTWKGIIINADAGTPVHAIADGRVLYANWLRGFGLVIVLDHGDGYMSLYGHNQTIIPQVGTMVRARDTIALVGQSGGRSSPALYFEIRIKGNAVNPTRWVR